MGKQKKYHGVVVPMITPFTNDGRIDIPGAERVVEHIVAGGACPFVLGTTGEAASVSDSERPDFVEATVRQTAGRTLTYAGIAGNCLPTSIDAAKKYFDLGIDVVVAHLPSYYPIKDYHMLRYFETLAESIPGPLMIYNITITTHMSIPLEVVEKLSYHPNIVGLKDSEKDDPRLEKAVQMWKDRTDFAHLVGSAVLSAKGLLLGSDGIVPSTGNFVPKLYVDLYKAAVRGDDAKANELQQKTNDLGAIYQKNRILAESLSALKVIMNQMGLCGKAVLPPLIEVGEDEEAEISKQLVQAGITK
jgi:4-hydroxy-tetrahydrodipicolinate synthase